VRSECSHIAKTETCVLLIFGCILRLPMDAMIIIFQIFYVGKPILTSELVEMMLDLVWFGLTKQNGAIKRLLTEKAKPWTLVTSV